MTALTDIGEISISDSREGGKDYLLRPSFEAMTRIGTPEEIVQAYATIHGSDVAQLIEVCSGTLGRFPAWLSPSFNRAAEKLFFASWQVLQACCEEDLTPMIGEWKAWSNCVVYRPRQIFTRDQHRAFMQWLRSPNYLDNCNQWFTMRLGTGTGDTGLEVQELHFLSWPTWSQSGSIFTWSGDVVARELVNSDDEFDDIIVELPPPWGSWLDIIVTGYPDGRDPESLPRVP